MSDSLERPATLLELPSYLASQTSVYGRRHLESVLAQHDLALTHHALLAALHDFGAQSQQELADRLRLDKSHLVARIDQLEQRDLLRREIDPNDRRRHRVTLTEAGDRFIAGLRPVALESQRRFLAPLTETERTELVRLLRRVLDANDTRAADR